MSNDAAQPWPDLLDSLQPGGPELEPESFPCPHCDKVFPSQRQLNGHLAHHAQKAKPKVICPECGREFSAGVGIASHRARAHGVPGVTRTQAARERKTARERERRAEKKAAAKIDKIETHEWDVDDIFETVAGTMWPKGVVPLSAVIPLMIWREATRQLIESINSQT